MGTIAKALKKHKAELTGSLPAELEAESPYEAPLSAPKPQAAPMAAAGEAHALPPPRTSAGEPLEDAIRPAPSDGPAVARRIAFQSEMTVAARSEGRSVKASPPSAEAPAKAEARLEPASVPAGPKEEIGPDMVSLLDPDSPEAELFRILRTQILFPQTGRPPRTILVTSALPEEGKSFVAANLAVNIAKNVDEHVLLVDCDLRRPSIHTKFGYNRCKGLSEYLSGGLKLSSLLLKTGVKKLTLLPSGAPPQNPSELITSSRMAALVQELKARYEDRYIIFDSPPPMVAPETAAIAKWVDGTLLVVKYGTTPMSLVEELITLLDREKIIGAVINQFDLREFRRYSYKKYYGYSYKKHYKDDRKA